MLSGRNFLRGGKIRGIKNGQLNHSQKKNARTFGSRDAREQSWLAQDKKVRYGLPLGLRSKSKKALQLCDQAAAPAAMKGVG